MKDFVGRPLELGDSVVVMAPGYRHLVMAKVIDFTPRSVRVAFMNTWNFGKTGMYTELMQSPDALVKVDGPDLTTFILCNAPPVIQDANN